MARLRQQRNGTQPLTTAQKLGSLVKSARDIMRKDKGLNGDLDRLPMLTWIMFLKFLDDMETLHAQEAELAGTRYRPLIAPPYRWRDWAAEESGIAGPELFAFINQDEAVRPDGTRGAGLFAYLRTLQSADGQGREEVVANVFRGVANRMESGYLLRDVINKVNGIHFNASDEIHTLSNLYESMLREMRDAAGDSGEFYTPRPVVKFMVAVTDPTLGETILDPACGTGGFLVETFQHLEQQCRTVQKRRQLQQESVFGQEAKPLPYMLAQMNLLLHGLESPHITYSNTLTVQIAGIGDRDRVDVILTNPPFGGEEEASVRQSFPASMQTSETALLFLQFIMRKLKRPEHNHGKAGRAAVVVPNGTLFGDGICARIKEQLLKEFNLHTIVRLPNGVFAPYTIIPTNILFFDRTGPTRDIWYYEIPLAEGRKNYTKTQPMQFEEFANCMAWWENREENDHAWRVDFHVRLDDAITRTTPHRQAAETATAYAIERETEVRKLDAELKESQQQSSMLHLFTTKEIAQRRDTLLVQASRQRQIARDELAAGDAIYWPVFNLDLKNPNTAQDFEHLPPEQLVDDIFMKEQRILEIMTEIKQVLAETAK